MSNPVGPDAAHPRHRSRQRREGRLRAGRLPRRARRRAGPRGAHVRRRGPLPPRAGGGGRRLRRARRRLLGPDARDRAPGRGGGQSPLAPGARARGRRRHRPRPPGGAGDGGRHAGLPPGPAAPGDRARGTAHRARALVGRDAGLGRARARPRGLRRGARAPVRRLSRRPARDRSPRPRPARPGGARRAAPGARALGRDAGLPLRLRRPPAAAARCDRDAGGPRGRAGHRVAGLRAGAGGVRRARRDLSGAHGPRRPSTSSCRRSPSTTSAPRCMRSSARCSSRPRPGAPTRATR